MQDLKLTQLPDGTIDFILSGGVYETVDGFETSIAASLLSNGENTNAESYQSTNGFWGNVCDSSNHYGNLAYLYMSRNDANNQYLANKQLQLSLQWLIDNKFAISVSVSVSTASNITTYAPNINIAANKQAGTQSALLWSKTIAELTPATIS